MRCVLQNSGKRRTRLHFFPEEVGTLFLDFFVVEAHDAIMIVIVIVIAIGRFESMIHSSRCDYYFWFLVN